MPHAAHRKRFFNVGVVEDDEGTLAAQLLRARRSTRRHTSLPPSFFLSFSLCVCVCLSVCMCVCVSVGHTHTHTHTHFRSRTHQRHALEVGFRGHPLDLVTDRRRAGERNLVHVRVQSQRLHTRTRAHAHTYMHTHTRIHTHARTHTQSNRRVRAGRHGTVPGPRWAHSH